MTTLAPSEIARTVEFGEAEAYADMITATPRELAASLGLELKRLGPVVVLTMSTVDIPLFNRAVGLGVAEPATEVMVDEIIAHFRAAGMRNFAIQISPEAQPTSLRGWLTARGFRSDDNWVKVIRRTEPPPIIATDLRIERIGPQQAGAFSTVALAAFGMPPLMRAWIEAAIGRSGWRHYVAFDGDQPVAAGALFIKDRVGWLGIGGTLPSHRGRGAQGALMVQRLRDGIALGCDWLVTETGEETPERPNPSYHNMLRTGFRLVYPRPNYMRRDA